MSGGTCRTSGKEGATGSQEVPDEHLECSSGEKGANPPYVQKSVLQSLLFSVKQINSAITPTVAAVRMRQFIVNPFWSETAEPPGNMHSV